MIGHLDKVFQNRFDCEKELKTSEQNKIFLVRDKETRKRHVCLQIPDSGEVYRKMRRSLSKNAEHQLPFPSKN